MWASSRLGGVLGIPMAGGYGSMKTTRVSINGGWITTSGSSNWTYGVLKIGDGLRW